MTANKKHARCKPVQPWQKHPARSAYLPPLEDRYRLSLMRQAARTVLQNKPRRYLEDKTGRSGAWWQNVARGDWDQCRPTLIDFYVIRAVAGVVSDESQLDTALLTKLTRVMECTGALVAAITELISTVRTHAHKPVEGG